MANLDVMHKIIEDVTIRFQKQKDEVIKNRIIELGYKHLINGIEKRRFPKILHEVHPTKESVYIDNDTDEGLHVVTFIKPDPLDLIRDIDINRKFELKLAQNYFF